MNYCFTGAPKESEKNFQFAHVYGVCRFCVIAGAVLCGGSLLCPVQWEKLQLALPYSVALSRSRFTSAHFIPKLLFLSQLMPLCFRRACQVTGDQEQSGAEAVWPALVRWGLQEGQGAGQPPRDPEDADRSGQYLLQLSGACVFAWVHSPELTMASCPLCWPRR